MKTVLNATITLFNPQDARNYASENLVFNVFVYGSMSRDSPPKQTAKQSVFLSKSVKKSVKRGVRVIRARTARTARASHARQVTRLNLFKVLKLGLRCSGRKSILNPFTSSRRLESRNIQFGFEFEFIMITLFSWCVR